VNRGGTNSQDVVAVESFRSARAFLDALHPSDKRWRANPASWIFRGHADSNWRLLPSAFRRESLAAFDDRAPDPATLPEDARAAGERLILRQFGEGLDLVGLPLPGMSRAALDELKPETPHAPQWPRECLELAALAQHHGVPTRLLDFTRSGHVAAYFAGQRPLGSTEGSIAVWALDTAFLEHGTRCATIWFELARVSRAVNPNLHAQSGVFVVWTGSDELLSLDAIVAGVCSGALPLCSGSVRKSRPIMRKLVLPARHGPELLGLLVDERISGATLFPGVEGVVRQLKEARIHRRFTAVHS